ncbi:TetR/AcrR family transcriptional regulator [Spirosoma validum]|uniref:TetR/AcrR family transcriptional regulator n=1 Tax=Spirosoma validum TaxID=2771355 RepID=A0A927B018_9BACT|nr:TetR/AcrR family transcriptional regulator [Spirosoma validum]MBD2752909.1 TetR/AcrR family transcriptional regulator [Spirosoma validum]
MKERIIAEARQLFNHLGVKTVRLEDIAQQLGISKKTVYQHFDSKEELVRLMLETQLNENLREANAIHKQVADPIASALLIWDRLSHYRRTVNPNLLRDIERHYPTVWHLFQSFRTEYINTILIANLHEGIEQGLYRTDLDETVIAWLWADQSQRETPYDHSDVAIKHHFVRGLLTQKGLYLYEAIKSRDE